jgi:hypothetical protein
MIITNKKADKILDEVREHFKETKNISDVKVLRQLQAGRYIFLETSCITYDYDNLEDKMTSVATQIIDSEDLSIILPIMLEHRVRIIDGTRITPQIIQGEAYVKLWALYEEIKKEAENQGIYVEHYIALYDKESLFNEILSSYDRNEYDYLKNWKEAYKEATNGSYRLNREQRRTK